MYGQGPSAAQLARDRAARARGVDVQVDALPAVRVTLKQGAQVPGVALGARHRVRVRAPDGSALASFDFDFADYESDVVCVYDDAFYANWRIKRADRLDRCRCTEQPRKLRTRGGALVQ